MPNIPACASALLVLLFLCVAAPGSADSIKNGYLKLDFDGPVLSALSVDPGGKGEFGKPLLTNLAFGAGLSMSPRTSPSAGRSFAGSVKVAAMDGRSQSNNPFLLKAGHTLGVLFTSPIEEMTAAGLRVPTWNHSDAGATLRLYRAEKTDDGFKTGALVAQRRVTNHPDNTWMELELEPQPPGTYYLEMSAPHKEIGVWGDTAAPRAGDSFADGKPVEANLNYRFSGHRPVKGSLSYTLDGATLGISFAAEDAAAAFPEASFETAWQRSGHDLAPSPVDACYNTSGQWIYLNQLKRRPHSTAMLPCDQLVLRAFDNYEIVVDFSRGAKFDWFAEQEGRLLWKGGAPGMNLTVRPASKEPPSWAPVFECSDARLARLTNEFYLSHGANFGVGTHPDWKEWQGQILSWTASPLNSTVKDQLARGYKMTGEGYVYTWGSEIGWPFPAADADGDGQNDYDTRHFTTNSCFILGAWRLISWTRDDDFARQVLPRARQAMEYQLKQLKGEGGVLVTNAEGHTGAHGGIGSNYWDILPFGHKDAFSNIYFIASLDAMAGIEEYAALRGIKAPDAAKARSPQEYRALASKARSAFRSTFWLEKESRFAGCEDVNGNLHDYGFSFVNLEAASRMIPTASQAKRMFRWLETAVTSSGKADMYSRWVFAPRSLAIHNPRKTDPQTPKPSWWFFGWPGTEFDGQCQAGGAILYVSFYDLMARLNYLGPDNALARYRAILDRYAEPDRLSGGSPLFRGEQTQGGPGGGAGSVGVEGEFPESGLVPCFVLHGLMGLEPSARGLTIHPRLPLSLQWIRCRNVAYGGELYTFDVRPEAVTARRQKDGASVTKRLSGGRAEFVPSREKWQ